MYHIWLRIAISSVCFLEFVIFRLGTNFASTCQNNTNCNIVMAECMQEKMKAPEFELCKDVEIIRQSFEMPEDDESASSWWNKSILMCRSIGLGNFVWITFTEYRRACDTFIYDWILKWDVHKHAIFLEKFISIFWFVYPTSQTRVHATLKIVLLWYENNFTTICSNKILSNLQYLCKIVILIKDRGKFQAFLEYLNNDTFIF